MIVTRALRLPCSTEEAWAVLTDWERQADWMLDADRVVVDSKQREGAGVRLRVRTRIFGIPAFTETLEVIGWDPPDRLVIEHGKPVAGTGSWELTGSPVGCLFTWTEDVRLRIPIVGGLAARIYAPVLGWLMGRAMRGLRSAFD